MNIASKTSRALLGLVFTIFGLNGFLHFIPMAPVPALAGQFLGALFASNYLSVIFAVQLIAGLMLLANWHVPLALTGLAPVIVNILLFHIFLAPAGLPLALFVAVLWGFEAYRWRAAFAPLFQVQTEATSLRAERDHGTVAARA